MTSETLSIDSAAASLLDKASGLRLPDAPPQRVGPVVVAHRGASADAPENTLAALLEAVRLGADVVEFDVRRTRDGAFVLCHDAGLERTTDARQALPGRSSWLVGDLTLDEIRRVDAGRWKSSSFAGERVPTLEEALEVLRPTGVDALVELKSPADHPDTVPTLAAVLSRARLVPSRITVQSFDAEFVRDLRQTFPAVRAGVLLHRVTRARIREIAGWADLVNVHHQRVSRGMVEEVQTHGLGCFAWTVNHPYAVRRILALGVDGVVTDHPDRLLRWQ